MASLRWAMRRKALYAISGMDRSTNAFGMDCSPRPHRPHVATAGFDGACKSLNKAKISIIIPALNERESIGHVVALMPWSDIAECIVVDNGSTDGTGDIASSAGARVITSPRGYGAA